MIETVWRKRHLLSMQKSYKTMLPLKKVIQESILVIMYLIQNSTLFLNNLAFSLILSGPTEECRESKHVCIYKEYGGAFLKEVMY